MAYETYGENKSNFIILAIFDEKSDAVAKSWNQKYNVKYPTISGNSGGSNITNKYFGAVMGFIPCYLLIEPSKKVVEKDIYPNGSNLMPMLKKYPLGVTGISEKIEKCSNFSTYFQKNGDKNTLNMKLTKAGIYSLKIFSVDGKLIGFIENRFYKEGIYKTPFDFRSYSEQVILFRLQFGEKSIFGRIN